MEKSSLEDQSQHQNFYIPFSDRRIIAASSPRCFSRQNRSDFLTQLHLSSESLCLVKQIHTADIVRVDSAAEHSSEQEADALITGEPGVSLGILTADCLPVFIWDPFQAVIGLAHAGWRGVKAGIIPKTILALQKEFESRPSTLQVALGPAIRSCCYEVGPEFQNYFPKHYASTETGTKGYMDLAGEAKEQILGSGVPSSFIFDSKICTVCQNAKYFSARKEHTQERILSVLSLR